MNVGHDQDKKRQFALETLEGMPVINASFKMPDAGYVGVQEDLLDYSPGDADPSDVRDMEEVFDTLYEEAEWIETQYLGEWDKEAWKSEEPDLDRLQDDLEFLASYESEFPIGFTPFNITEVYELGLTADEFVGLKERNYEKKFENY